MSNEYKVVIDTKIRDIWNKNPGPHRWCGEKIGKYGITWYCITYKNKDIYYFKNEDDYILFLLTWR
jgi:hypothetical protein